MLQTAHYMYHDNARDEKNPRNRKTTEMRPQLPTLGMADLGQSWTALWNYTRLMDFIWSYRIADFVQCLLALQKKKKLPDLWTL